MHLLFALFYRVWLRLFWFVAKECRQIKFVEVFLQLLFQCFVDFRYFHLDDSFFLLELWLFTLWLCVDSVTISLSVILASIVMVVFLALIVVASILILVTWTLLELWLIVILAVLALATSTVIVVLTRGLVSWLGLPVWITRASFTLFLIVHECRLDRLLIHLSMLWSLLILATCASLRTTAISCRWICSSCTLVALFLLFAKTSAFLAEVNRLVYFSMGWVWLIRLLTFIVRLFLWRLLRCLWLCVCSSAAKTDLNDFTCGLLARSLFLSHNFLGLVYFTYYLQPK